MAEAGEHGNERSVERARGGDSAALRELYDAHVERIHRTAYRLSGDADLARDWTQDTFVRAFRSLDRFRGQSSFGTWLHSIAISVVLNGLRSRKRRARWESLWGHARADHSSVDSRAVPGDSQRLSRRLEQALAQLSDGLRAVVVLTEIEGLSHAEAAEVLGTSEGACRARLSRAKALLREQLVDLAITGSTTASTFRGEPGGWRAEESHPLRSDA